MNGLHVGGDSLLCKGQFLQLQQQQQQAQLLSASKSESASLVRTRRSPTAIGSTEQTSAAAEATSSSGNSTATTMTGSVGPFRIQSSSHRCSRERYRTWTHGSHQGRLLASGPMEGGIPLRGVATNVDIGSSRAFVADDMRLSGNEDICNQSFASDDLDAAGGSVDGSSKEHHRRREHTSFLQTLDRLNTKIQCTKEAIRKEQTSRDDNVNKYLNKLATSANKQQMKRLKTVYEKKNQKSAHSIAQLQKKLDSYTKRVKELQNQQHQHESHEVRRDVGHGLRRYRWLKHLMETRFGSGDTINKMSKAELNNLNILANQDVLGVASTGCEGSSTTCSKFNSENCSECSSVTSDNTPAGWYFSSANSLSNASQYHILMNSRAELAQRKVEIVKLIERIGRLENAQKDFNNLTSALKDKRYRAERLQDQIYDLTELHQNEIENLKQTIVDMEEKIQYQSDDRLRDVNEVLENYQTRISKMELISQQQCVTVEGVDNSNAHALAVKIINVVLTILQVVLLLVATVAGIIMPFFKTRVYVLITFLSIFILICVLRQWPDIEDIGVALLHQESWVVE